MDEEAPIDDCLLQDAESEALPEVSAAEETQAQ
jgi:hypothetical protein